MPAVTAQRCRLVLLVADGPLQHLRIRLTPRKFRMPGAKVVRLLSRDYFRIRGCRPRVSHYCGPLNTVMGEETYIKLGWQPCVVLFDFWSCHDESLADNFEIFLDLGINRVGYLADPQQKGF